MRNPDYIENLNKTLAGSVSQSANEINFLHRKLAELYRLKKEGKGENVCSDIIILEVYLSLHYTIIAAASFIRADFGTDLVVEKRLNLKYLSFISTEFYKSLFIIKKPDTLWQKLKAILLTDNYPSLKKVVDKVNAAADEFQTKYYRPERRNVALHYDFDLDKVYNHLCEISEEYETRQTAALFAILEPLSLVCSVYVGTKFPDFFNFNLESENNAHEVLRKKLSDEIFEIAGAHIARIGEFLDQNMRSYHIIDNPKIRKLLSTDDYNRISNLRENFTLSILLHYIYLDLTTAIRGFLRAENYYERQLHVIRINLIIFEGFKKIYLPPNKDNDQKSLWETNIKTPVLKSEVSCDITEMESIEEKLLEYAAYEDIRETRHAYSHFRKGNRLYLFDLWHRVNSIKPLEELFKAIRFTQIINRIICLNKKTLDYYNQKEETEFKQRLSAPLDDIFTKALESCETTQQKEKILAFKDKLEKTLSETLERKLNRRLKS